jgi:hypothetical protein
VAWPQDGRTVCSDRAAAHPSVLPNVFLTCRHDSHERALGTVSFDDDGSIYLRSISTRSPGAVAYARRGE